MKRKGVCHAQGTAVFNGLVFEDGTFSVLLGSLLGECRRKISVDDLIIAQGKSPNNEWW